MGQLRAAWAVIWLGACAQGAVAPGETQVDMDPSAGALDEAGVDAAAQVPPVAADDGGPLEVDGGATLPDGGEELGDAGALPDATPPEPEPEPACELPAGNFCQTPRDLGEVNGDTTGGPTLETTGTGPLWVRVRVKENSSFGDALSFTAELTSTAQADYDLHVYRGDTPNGLNCANATWHSTGPAGAVERVAESWDNEGLFGNGADDGRVLAIHVEHVSGACDPFTLRVYGKR